MTGFYSRPIKYDLWDDGGGEWDQYFKKFLRTLNVQLRLLMCGVMEEWGGGGKEEWEWRMNRSVKRQEQGPWN